MDTENKQHFGPWKQQKTLSGHHGHCFLVRKSENQPLHVLKTAAKNSMLSGETETERDKRQAHSMQQEIETIKRLTDHPNIITLVDYDSEAKIPWHVTKYCSGGDLFQYGFDDWSVDELKTNAIQEKINTIAKAIGYANSKGISLGNDIDVFVTKDRRFIVGDLETATIWENHHIDTTDDIQAFARIHYRIKEKAERSRRKRLRERERQHETQRALEQAQPSAPRRLAKYSAK